MIRPEATEADPLSPPGHDLESAPSELPQRPDDHGVHRGCRERARELEAARANLEAYAGIVAHDLQAPVRAIGFFSQALMRHGAAGPDDDGRHYLDNVIAASEVAARLIDERGVAERRCQWFRGFEARRSRDQSIVEGQAQPIDDRCQDHRPSPHRLPAQPGVREQIVEQILMNLVGNAMSYQREDAPARVRIQSNQKDGFVEITVADEGLGIEPQVQQHNFEPGVRLHSDDEYPGTGMGLAITHRAALLLDGTVAVESSPGVGSTFRVRLPSVDRAGTAEHRPAVRQPLSASS